MLTGRRWKASGCLFPLREQTLPCFCERKVWPSVRSLAAALPSAAERSWEHRKIESCPQRLASFVVILNERKPSTIKEKYYERTNENQIQRREGSQTSGEHRLV